MRRDAINISTKILLIKNVYRNHRRNIQEFSVQLCWSLNGKNYILNLIRHNLKRLRSTNCRRIYIKVSRENIIGKYKWKLSHICVHLCENYPNCMHQPLLTNRRIIEVQQVQIGAAIAQLLWTVLQYVAAALVPTPLKTLHPRYPFCVGFSYTIISFTILCNFHFYFTNNILCFYFNHLSQSKMFFKNIAHQSAVCVCVLIKYIYILTTRARASA